MSSCASRRLIAGLAMLFAAACGGGGSGGSGPTAPPASPPSAVPPGPIVGNASEFLPSATRAAYVLHGKTATNLQYVNEVEVSLVNASSSSQLLRVRESQPYDGAEAVRSAALDASGLSIQSSAGDLRLSLPGVLRAGERRTVVNAVRSSVPDSDRDGRPETLETTEDLTVVGLEPVATPLQDFAEALRTTVRRTEAYIYSRDGRTAVAITDFDQWYVRGTGLVRRTMTREGTRWFDEALAGHDLGSGWTGQTFVRSVIKQWRVSASPRAVEGSTAAYIVAAEAPDVDTTPLIQVFEAGPDGTTGTGQPLFRSTPRTFFGHVNLQTEIAASGDSFVVLALRDGRLIGKAFRAGAVSSSAPEFVYAQEVDDSPSVGSPALAVINDRFVAFWVETAFEYEPSVAYVSRLRGQRLRLDASPDGSAFTIATFSDLYPPVGKLIVAHKPTGALLVFERYDQITLNSVVHRLPYISGQLLDETASPLGSPFTIANARGGQSNPAATWRGDHYWVAWLDDRDAPQISQIIAGTGSKIYIARLTENGTSVSGPPDTAGIALSDEGLGAGIAPSFVSSASGLRLAWISYSGRPGVYYRALRDDGTAVPGLLSGRPAALALNGSGALARRIGSGVFTFELQGQTVIGWAGSQASFPDALDGIEIVRLATSR